MPIINDVPIIGEKEEPTLPDFQDKADYLGKMDIDKLQPLDLIAMGLTDVSEVELYLGHLEGSWYVRFLPRDSLAEIGWKNQCKAAAKTDQTTIYPEVPDNYVWSDKGFVTDINIFQDRHHEHLYEALREEVLCKIDLFSQSKRKREEDPWRF